MKESFKQYAKTIINDYLKLQRGDALSVNAEENQLEEAKYLASEALEITGANVKIVTTIDGKPQEVIEFDAPNQLTTQITGLAMVRLISDEKNVLEDPDEFDSGNLRQIQMLGHLAEPLEIGRRIAVPWCVANVNSETDEVNLSKLSEEVKYRQSYMRHYDIHRMHITGKGTDLFFELPEDIFFVSGIVSLSNGRSFLTGKDFDRILFTVDKFSATGFFTANTSIAGREKEIRFEFDKGQLVNHTSDPVLDRLLCFDQDISKLGSVSLRDKEIIINLGGSDTKSLASVPETEEELPKEFNTSLFTIKCNLGNEMNVSFTDCENHERELIRKGFFVE